MACLLTGEKGDLSWRVHNSSRHDPSGLPDREGDLVLPRPTRRFRWFGRIVGDIVRTHSEAVKLQEEIAYCSPRRQTEVKDRLELAMHHMEDYVDELSEIGCDLKDYQMGLIDFTGRHRGHDVCLCWKFGEEAIGYWHELESGFGEDSRFRRWKKRMGEIRNQKSEIRHRHAQARKSNPKSK